MFVTPRLYHLYQSDHIFAAKLKKSGPGFQDKNRCTTIRSSEPVAEMLLLHQIGSVKVGETVRYTITYIPSQDRILPTPGKLYVRVRNTSAVALRAAYLHGPYTLYTACYPASFDPNAKSPYGKEDGVPQFESLLKAGGSWDAAIIIPERIKENAQSANVRRNIDGSIPSCTWRVDISSQVLFSTSANVHYEIVVGRDERSIEQTSNNLSGNVPAPAGDLKDYQKKESDRNNQRVTQKGVFSKAISLTVEDTEALWNKPTLHDGGRRRMRRNPDRTPIDGGQAADAPKDTDQRESGTGMGKKSKRQRRIHLVVITHGLHSNTGSDMLYLKESIDKAAKEAREDVKKRKAALRKQEAAARAAHLAEAKGKQHESARDKAGEDTGKPSGINTDEHLFPENDVSDSDEEEVICKGFSGNVIRTERGLQYLGKRLAKYVLSVTYPDQPYLPIKKSMSKKVSQAFGNPGSSNGKAGEPSHQHSSIEERGVKGSKLPYRFTSISFVGHSLGGLTQTYAIAYIYKHSPRFFEKIKPINFIALATPFLGLNHENPIYVKFALDFGLVGKTGQDLGLAWRAPNFARSGWAALIGGTGTEGQRAQRQLDPGSKPLLRLLPAGPAHHVLRMFRNKTVYANVVNDGIVPLRTSCLLFLDWRGLGRVEKARRENGLVGTVAGWGWAELTGANSSIQKMSRKGLLGGDASGRSSPVEEQGDSGSNTPTQHGQGDTVPQPAENATFEDSIEDGLGEPAESQFLKQTPQHIENEDHEADIAKTGSSSSNTRPFSALLSFLMPNSAGQSHHHQPKQSKIYKRGQTIGSDHGQHSPELKASTSEISADSRSTVSRGDTIGKDPENVFAPPKTTFFESAGDILNPPIPSEDFLTDPTTRPRTIFHDRVYHPDDIPAPPPAKRRSSIMRTLSGDIKSKSRHDTIYSSLGDDQSFTSRESQEGGMKVEEKTARAYHKDLSWRKVLVRLEPDAHNNIIVRRMFSNAYGWPVVKHLVDTHFADTYAAKTEDRDEPSVERARPMDQAVGERGEEVKVQRDMPTEQPQELIYSPDSFEYGLKSPAETILSHRSGRPKITRQESSLWDDRYFEGTDDEYDNESDVSASETASHSSQRASRKHTLSSGIPLSMTTEPEVLDFLSASPTKLTDEGSIPEDVHPPRDGSITPTPKSLLFHAPSHASTSAIPASRVGLRAAGNDPLSREHNSGPHP